MKFNYFSHFAHTTSQCRMFEPQPSYWETNSNPQHLQCELNFWVFFLVLTNPPCWEAKFLALALNPHAIVMRSQLLISCWEPQSLHQELKSLSHVCSNFKDTLHIGKQVLGWRFLSIWLFKDSLEKFSFVFLSWNCAKLCLIFSS